jgi:Ca-activated chloride channel family protein
MGVTNSNKLISADVIDCDGSLKVTLALTAAPEIITNPTDIVLVLDRSGSIAGTPLANMKAGANTFIDIIEEATDGTKDGVIGSGSRIGVVSFADTALVNAQLITSVTTLKNAVNALTAGGLTNHADAFSKAAQLFDPNSSNQKVIVLFTDGNTTTGLPPAPVAAAAKADRILIYCIGLIGSDGVDVNALNTWASDPDSSYVSVTPDDADLEELFAELAANISKPGATDIVIDEVVNADFTITNILPPNKGSVDQLLPTSLRWSIPELGATASEGAQLEFFIKHTASTPGTKQVNQFINYSDNEGNLVLFPSPKVTVECDIIVHPEGCPIPIDFSVDGCSDSELVDLGELNLSSQGRIVQLDVTLKNVCPDRRVSLAVILTEVDENGMEYQRGMKAMTIPAHKAPGCRDVLVKCIPFVLPEDLDVSGDAASLCNTRHLKARLIAHNIDTDYRCCEADITL